MICESREVHLDALDAGALHLVDGVIRGQCFHGVQCSMTTMEDEGREGDSEFMKAWWWERERDYELYGDGQGSHGDRGVSVVAQCQGGKMEERLSLLEAGHDLPGYGVVVDGM